MLSLKFPHVLIHHRLHYYVCLWLNERSLTYEKPQLERHGVGGVFHFLWQNANMEGAQGPTVYIFSGIDRASRTVWSWMYRVVPVQGGLYIEANDPYMERATRDVIFDSAARYDLDAHITTVDFPKLIERELAALPYYYFCGFGFVDPSDRRKTFGFFSPTGGKREDIVDSSGKPTPFIANMIYDNFGLITLDTIEFIPHKQQIPTELSESDTTV